MGLAKAIYSKSQLRGQFDNHGNFIYLSLFFSFLRLLKTWNPLEFPSSKQGIQVSMCGISLKQYEKTVLQMTIQLLQRLRIRRYQKRLLLLANRENRRLYRFELFPFLSLDAI